MKKVIFVAVNYNNHSFTKKFVNSIIEQTPSEAVIDIIIVDNNSDENDWKSLQESIGTMSNIKLSRNANNIGYFRALNVGIEMIKDKNNSLIVICNNDLEFRKDFVQKLITIPYSQNTMVLAPNVITKNGYNQNPHCIKRVSTFRKLCYKIHYTNYYLGRIMYWAAQKMKPKKNTQNLSSKTSQFIYMGIGACYVLTPHFFEHFDRLDDSVFLWGEEALLAGQINSVSGKMWYDTEIVVYHSENTSVSKIPSKEAYNITKTSFKTYAKHL